MDKVLVIVAIGFVDFRDSNYSPEHILSFLMVTAVGIAFFPSFYGKCIFIVAAVVRANFSIQY